MKHGKGDKVYWPYHKCWGEITDVFTAPHCPNIYYIYWELDRSYLSHSWKDKDFYYNGIKVIPKPNSIKFIERLPDEESTKVS